MLNEFFSHPQKTMVTVVLDHDENEWENAEVYGTSPRILIGEWEAIYSQLMSRHISKYHVFSNSHRSQWPLEEYHQLNCRIEPGALIRKGVRLDEDVVVMMGAVINVAAVIQEKTMIDMNAVIGSRACIGKRCHIAAGAVVSGVLEPASAVPVMIEDDVFVGANAVILEGVHIGKGAVVAAGAVVTEEVKENTVVAGVPAKVISMVKEQTRKKTEIEDKLRKKLI